MDKLNTSSGDRASQLTHVVESVVKGIDVRSAEALKIEGRINEVYQSGLNTNERVEKIGQLLDVQDELLGEPRGLMSKFSRKK